jgi:hypothetical protein
MSQTTRCLRGPRSSLTAHDRDGDQDRGASVGARTGRLAASL